MKYRICLTVILIFLVLLSKAQNKVNLSDSSFFHGTKIFCSDYRKTKYKLSINGNEITIIAIYNGEHTIKGIIKNGKIYSNDPFEKNNKMLAGKVYVFKNSTFKILTSEGGKYDEFNECR